MTNTQSKVIRTVFLSVAAIVLCLLLMVSGSYALFTDEVTVNNHLQAGTLNVTLKRTKLEKTAVAENGYIVTAQPDTSVVDFSESTSENVFGLTNTSKVVPGTELSATMQLSNHSDVAFAYWIEIKQTGLTENEAIAQTALANQLKVTVTGASKSATVTQGLKVGSETAPLGEIAVGSTGTFVVTVEFENLASNNDAQNQQIAFDLIVYAVQVLYN